MAHGGISSFDSRRCRLQRLRDIKFINGWVQSIDPNQVRVVAASSMLLEFGDVFAFEVFGETEVASFTGQLTSVAPTTDFVAGGESEPDRLLLDFKIAGAINYKNSEQVSRRLVKNCQATIKEPMETVKVHDVSEWGVGFVGTTRHKSNSLIEMSISHGDQVINVSGTVRYSRRDVASGENYRTGVKLDELDRLEFARWRSFVAEL